MCHVFMSHLCVKCLYVLWVWGSYLFNWMCVVCHVFMPHFSNHPHKNLHVEKCDENRNVFFTPKMYKSKIIFSKQILEVKKKKIEVEKKIWQNLILFGICVWKRIKIFNPHLKKQNVGNAKKWKTKQKCISNYITRTLMLHFSHPGDKHLQPNTYINYIMTHPTYSKWVHTVSQKMFNRHLNETFTYFENFAPHTVLSWISRFHTMACPLGIKKSFFASKCLTKLHLPMNVISVLFVMRIICFFINPHRKL